MSLKSTFPSNMGKRPDEGRQQELACGSNPERNWLAGGVLWWPFRILWHFTQGNRRGLRVLILDILYSKADT